MLIDQFRVDHVTSQEQLNTILAKTTQFTRSTNTCHSCNDVRPVSQTHAYITGMVYGTSPRQVRVIGNSLDTLTHAA